MDGLNVAVFGLARCTRKARIRCLDVQHCFISTAASGEEWGFGVLARHVVILTQKLNAASYAMKPDGTVPKWLQDPTDRNLKIAGNYNPAGKRYIISARLNALAPALQHNVNFVTLLF